MAGSFARDRIVTSCMALIGFTAIITAPFFEVESIWSYLCVVGGCGSIGYLYSAANE